MSFDAVVIDERTLSRGSEAQHIEWDANIRELLAKIQDAVDYDATLHISLTEQHFVLEARSPKGDVLDSKTIPHELLSEHITEYVDILRQIASAEGVNQMEALDMAKKVTHDRAGRLLRRELRDFGFDHESMRKLFTLLLSLRVDTTRLVGIHTHRPIR
ncbi:MAG: UPF0262 family protein [Myxococcales bacterium]|jgi:uncharacterized protein (UPF0262 family)|nr:UPF0262 family protein [Myxococcales bacterium]MDH3845714.1 UPF0262 family protein [Myxococcales bacterium]